MRKHAASSEMIVIIATWIYKPLFGSQGDNIKLIKSYHDLDTFENLSNIYYFQKYLENID